MHHSAAFEQHEALPPEMRQGRVLSIVVMLAILAVIGLFLKYVA